MADDPVESLLDEYLSVELSPAQRSQLDQVATAARETFGNLGVSWPLAPAELRAAAATATCLAAMQSRGFDWSVAVGMLMRSMAEAE